MYFKGCDTVNKNKKFLFVFALFCMFCFLGFKNVQARPKVNRIYGHSRYETSLKMSQNEFTFAKNVIIASGEQFPDSLCASTLAKQLKAPIILMNTDIDSNYFKQVKQELIRLGANNVYLVGGKGVLTTEMEDEFNSMNLNTIRLGGNDRYETCSKIAKKINTDKIAFVTTGSSFADSVSIGAIAAKYSAPIILSSKDSISNDNLQYIKNKNFSKIYVLGGEKVISNRVFNKLPNAERIYGDNRYDTNYKVINKFCNNKLNKIFVADGKKFPDAIVASASAAKYDSFVVLCDKKVNDSMSKFLKQNLDDNGTVNILGGPLVIPDNIIDNIYNTSKPIIPAPKPSLPSNSNGIVVCIDPGHGYGDDVGATGNNVQEDDVTLAVSLKLGNILKSSGYNVVYTRTTDMRDKQISVGDSLQYRCDVAEKNNADCFICIHCNVFNRESANGTETYYSPENNKDNGSKTLAKCIQESIIREIGTNDRGVKTANWYVNKHTKCPSILVELGFLTNPNDVKKLNSSYYQQKYAKAIADGIKLFYSK